MQDNWKIRKYNVEIELLEDQLGTIPVSKSIFAKHLASKITQKGKRDGMTPEEIQERIDEDLESYDEDDSDLKAGYTTFFKDEDKNPYIKDYMIKGFLKDAASALKQFGKHKQLRSKVVKFVFIEPRKILLPKQEKYNVLERPLRAMTARGERVSIARSDTIPAGTIIKFTVVCLAGIISKKCLETLFEYGKYIGVGQFRSGGYGKFSVKKLELVSGEEVTEGE